MSFRKLVTITESNATAYPVLRSDAPITPRRFSDETDTDSNATSISEDTDIDDANQQLLDYQARVRRRAQAQARVRNTLQYAHDRINDGVRPVQDLANEIADDGDFIYNDVARPFLAEAIFQIRVVVTTISRLLLLLFWWTLENIWWTFWSTLDLIGETLMIIAYAVLYSIGFILELLRGILFALPQLLHDTPCWMLRPIAVVAGVVLVIISALHGLMRMSMYICNDSALAQGWTNLPEICTHTHTVAVLNIERRVLNRLVEASDAVIYSTADMSKVARLDSAPGTYLLTESTGLVQFAKTHSDKLASLSGPHDIEAIASAVHSNVTAFNQAFAMFKHIHTFRVDELQTKSKRILDVAKLYTPQSPAERFFLESASHYIPGTFSHTNVAHQASHYVGVSSQFLGDTQTTTLLQQGFDISRYVSDISKGIKIAEDVLAKYKPFWTLHLQTQASDHSDHDLVNPSDLAERLGKRHREVEEQAESLRKLYELHKDVKKGMTVLRSNLKLLLEAAVSGKPVSDVDAASARAILHRFAVELGKMDIMVGHGTYVIGVTLGEGDAKGSKYRRLADGRPVPHAQAYEK